MTTVDWSAETITGWTGFTASGASQIFGDEAFGSLYDATLDRFWFFGGRGLAFDRIYWVDAADFNDGAVTVYSQTFGGAGAIPIGTSSGGIGEYFGLYKRFCFVPEWRAIAVVTTYNVPVYIIKLPG